MNVRKRLLTALCSFLCFSAIAQDKIDLASLNLKGRVKSVNEITYEAVEKFGDLEKGKKTDRDFREFNTAGLEIQLVMEDFEDKDETFTRSTKYGNNNLPVEIRESEAGETGIMKVKYNGDQVEVIDVTDKKGKLQARQKNTYRDGLLVQEDSYNGDGKLVEKWVYSYNSKKQMTRREEFEDGKLSYEINNAYDSRGNIIETSSMDHKRKEKSAFVQKYVYNQKNQKTERRNSIAGFDKKEVFEYNFQGDLVKREDTYGKEEKTYTYDSHNNWITCTVTKVSHGDTTHTIIERQIKYY